MRTVYLLIGLLAATVTGTAQSIEQKLNIAMRQLAADSQMEHGIATLHVVNSATGKTVFTQLGDVGFAAASAQKVITAATALQVLGKDYRFKTEIGYSGILTGGTLHGDLYITGYGDPTLGSRRYASTQPNAFLQAIISQLKKKNIQNIEGEVYMQQANFSLQPLPGGWIWDDIGNYYGAGHYGLNWRENQYDLVLKAGQNEGDSTEILRTEPVLQNAVLVNQLLTGKKGSGDNAYIYLPPFSNTGFITGTIPAQSTSFTISGSFPNPAVQLQAEMQSAFKKAGIGGNYKFVNYVDAAKTKESISRPRENLFTYSSPPLDSIVYWFLKKSVNLYGEALIKAIAFEKTGYGSTDAGLSEVFFFWQAKGVDSNAIRMYDGSGLSPQNRITSKAFVNVMQYARSQPWFKAFYNALPEYNGIKMKSGTIGGAKSFTGYVTSKQGVDYTIAFIVNNYSGKPSQIVSKMYKVLDVLK